MGILMCRTTMLHDLKEKKTRLRRKTKREGVQVETRGGHDGFVMPPKRGDELARSLKVMRPLRNYSRETAQIFVTGDAHVSTSRSTQFPLQDVPLSEHSQSHRIMSQQTYMRGIWRTQARGQRIERNAHGTPITCGGKILRRCRAAVTYSGSTTFGL